MTDQLRGMSTDCSKSYLCYLHYDDGLTKKVKLTEQEFDENFEIWQGELNGTLEGGLVYLKVRAIKPKLTDGGIL